MSYQIRPIDFDSGIGTPENGDIIEFIERNSSQKVIIQGREFEGQFLVYFEGYPKDILEFSRKNNNITIYGDAGAAPALCEIFYSALISLGGDQKHEIELINFPVTNDYIENKNKELRSLLRKVGILFWVALLLLFIGVGGIMYTLLHWIINA